MMQRELHFVVPMAATQTVSASGTSAQSATFPSGGDVVVYSSVACFVLQGTNPTATTSCLPLKADTHYRLGGISPNNKLAFITAGGTGTVYLAPGA